MRKIFILIELSIFMCSCDSGQCYKSSAKIINNSGKEIEVISFRKEYVNGAVNLSQVFLKKTVLKNDENIDNSGELCPPFSGNIGLSSILGDSIVIDYGDRISKYSSSLQMYKDKDLRNPFYSLFINQENRDFIFILTPDDYTNAKLK